MDKKCFGKALSKTSFERIVKVNKMIDRISDGLLKQDIISIVGKNLQKIIGTFGFKCPYCKKESGLKAIQLWFDKKKVDKLASEIVNYIKKEVKK